MDSLANYGSDDDYEENSNDKMGPYKSGQSLPWNHQQQHTSARTEADVNYDEVQMDLSEESNNNNSAEDNDHSPRANNRTTDRKRPHKERDGAPRGKNHEYRSNRPRETKERDNDRDRTRKHDSKAKYDRDGPSGNHEERSKYVREGPHSYEDRQERSKYDRDGPTSHEGRSKYGSSYGEDRADKSKHGKDDRSAKNREDRTRKYSSGPKERRRSRSPRRNEYRRRSNSKDRDRASNGRGYGKRFDRTSNKMAQLEKLGIEIKTPDAEFVTPQMLLQRSMDEQVQKVKHSTGIELPKYYNPAAMNPARYAEQIQKRRLLWQKKDTPAPTTVPALPVAGAQPAQQPAVWEQTTFAQDQDGKVASKFKRLMGIRQTPATATGASGDVLKKQEEMFSSMEQQYEVARTATHTMRGVGLGFGTFQSYPR